MSFTAFFLSVFQPVSTDRLSPLSGWNHSFQFQLIIGVQAADFVVRHYEERKQDMDTNE